MVIGAVVPLTVVGLVALWGLWDAKRRQLDDSLERRTRRPLGSGRLPKTSTSAQVCEHRARSYGREWLVSAAPTQ